MFPLRPALLALAATLPVAAGPDQGTPDIFADFVIKQGSASARYYFTIKLDRDCAPVAVANFLGLVTGLQPWIDPATGLTSHEPFYDGLQIYKVVPHADFNATGNVYFGSPTNEDSGGPGYIIQDQSLNTGDGTYYAYLDNDGPNANGSRIFISLVSRSLNERYTRLGTVPNSTVPLGQSAWMNLSYFSDRPTDANGKPTTPLTIESITIRGWDENDPNFLIHLWGLPLIGDPGFEITRQNGSWRLLWPHLPGAFFNYYGSTDLQSWIGPFKSVTLPDATTTAGADITTDVQHSPRTFYRGAVTLYPEWPAHELNLVNTALTFDYKDDDRPGLPQRVLLKLSFDGSGRKGVWERYASREIPSNSVGTFSADYSATEPFIGTMVVTPETGSGLSAFTFNLHFRFHFPIEYTNHPNPPVLNRFEAYAPAPAPSTEVHVGDWFATQLPP